MLIARIHHVPPSLPFSSHLAAHGASGCASFRFVRKLRLPGWIIEAFSEKSRHLRSARARARKVNLIRSLPGRVYTLVPRWIHSVRETGDNYEYLCRIPSRQIYLIKFAEKISNIPYRILYSFAAGRQPLYSPRPILLAICFEQLNITAPEKSFAKSRTALN